MAYLTKTAYCCILYVRNKESLSEEKLTNLKFDIHAPCTIEAINAAKLVDAKVKKLCFSILGALAVCLFLLLILYLLGVDTSIKGPTVLVGVVAMLNLAVCAESIGVKEVPESDCARLMTACMATPEGQQYRAAVLAQGRKFLKEEAKMIYDWADTEGLRRACKTL